ncbi:MAG TPA: S9 family peptidase [Acetobacteraceae bacterium]
MSVATLPTATYAPESGPRRLCPADIFAFCHADDPRISPDVARICHVLVRRDQMRDVRHSVLMLSTDRTTWREIPRSDDAASPRWGPDSRHLAFLRRHAGGQALVVHDTDTGAEIVLLDTSAKLREIAWSPDGASIAFQMMVAEPEPAWLDLPHPPEGADWAPAFRMTERMLWRHDTTGDLPHGVFQIFVMDAAGGVPRQLTTGDWYSGFHIPPGLVFSADGTQLLLSATRRPDWDMAVHDLDLYAVAVAGGAVRRLTDRDGATACPTPSPDGSWIAFTAVEERHLSFQTRRLLVMPANGGAAREILPDADISIDMLAWDGDTPALLVVYVEHGHRVIARVTLDGDLTVLARDVGSAAIEMPYANGGFSVACDGTIAYLRTAIAHPGDVALIGRSGAATTITDVNAGLADSVGGFVDAETIWVTSRDGGHRIQCWLMLPPHQPDGAQVPLILSIHGGLFAQFWERFSIKHQMMAAAGYAVLYVNPRGSTGYGEAFATALHDAFPGPDYDDLMDALDTAAARPDIDADNLFVTGISGGGTLTLWSVAHTHRFRAAVSIKPVVSWESWVLTADIGPTVGPLWLGGALPWSDAAKLRVRSPLAHVAAVRTPTMLLAGDADHRTPASEALQMYTALKLAGVPTAFVRAPAVSHSSAVLRPSHFAAEVTCTLAWFERFRLAPKYLAPT